MEANDENQCLLVDGSNKILDAIIQNIPFKVIGLESVRLEQKSGYGQKLRINLDLLCRGLQISPGIKSLSFKECIFDAAPIEAAKCLGRLVRTHPTLETIKLGHTLYSEGFEYFFEGLRYNSTLKRLDATYIDVTEDAALALSESLRVNTTLEDLNMEGAKFGSFVGLKNIIEAIGVNTALKKLCISHIVNSEEDEDDEDASEPPKKRQKIGQEDEPQEPAVPQTIERKFCEALINNKTLTELNLTYSEIFPQLGEVLKKNHTLTSLEFGSSSLVPPTTVPEISAGLKVNTTLRRFHLDECEDFADQWGDIHFDALNTNSTLTSLGLSGSRMTENASEQLFATLSHNTSLRSLDLSAVEFSEVQQQQLKDYLCVNSTLTKLDFFGSAYDNPHLILEALHTNGCLRSLEIGGNKMNEQACKDFSMTLRQNTALQYLRISDCGINDRGAKLLADGLKHNTSLTSLDMTTNSIGKLGTSSVCFALEKHPMLTRLVYTTNVYDQEGAFGRLLSVNTTLETLVLDGAKNIASTTHLCNGLKVNTTLRSLESRQYCNKPQIEIEPCRNLLIDALQVNESVTQYEGYDVRVVDGIEPLLSKNQRLRKDRCNNILVLGHNIMRMHKRGEQIAFPIEVWKQIFHYVKYPGIKFKFSQVFQSVISKYK